MARWSFPNRQRVRHFPDEISDHHRIEGLVQLAIEADDFPGQPYPVVRALVGMAYVDAAASCAKDMTDAFVTRSDLRRYMDDTLINALARRIDEDTPGVLHRRGDTCPCLPERWSPVAEFFVHDFLKANGTRREQSTARQKRRELNNYRAEVFRRDRFMCRICLAMPDSLDDHRSPRSLQLGHIDPNAADGPANLATMCKACNEKLSSFTPDQKFVQLYAHPANPARSFEEAAETAEATRTAVRAMPRPVMPGHGAPVSPPPSPRPVDQVDPWNRAQIPAQPAAGPAPPDPIETGSPPDHDPFPDPIATRSASDTRTGSESGPRSGPQPGRLPAQPTGPPPDADYPGREGQGQPAPAITPAITPGLQRFLEGLPHGQPMPVWEISQLSGYTTKQVEIGLARLAAHHLVARHPAEHGQPVSWERIRE